MLTTKKPLKRYSIQERCFSNAGRHYTLEGLRESLNESILEKNLQSSGISIRQLRDDIAFMKSTDGWDAPFSTILKDGEKLRRSKKWQWLFLASGKWSRSPYRQGNVTLYYAHDPKKGWAALKQIGFPTSIVVVLKTYDSQSIEEIVSELLLELWYAEGYRIEMIADYDDTECVDLYLVEDLFLTKRKQKSSLKK